MPGEQAKIGLWRKLLENSEFVERDVFVVIIQSDLVDHLARDLSASEIEQRGFRRRCKS